MNIEKLAREAGFVAYGEDCGEYRIPTPAFKDRMKRFADLVLEEAVRVCDEIAEDRWALYKGHAPYTGYEEQRASDHTQGESDGADHCVYAIRALKDK